MMRPLPLSLASFAAGLLLLPLAICIYLVAGHPPVATADRAFPLEARIVQIPLEARIHREMPAASPIPASDENLIAAASLYEDKCEFCHGTATDASTVGRALYPPAPQLWIKHGSRAVGVSDDPIGETYWKIKNGIRLTGMPAYGNSLSERQLWQLSLLLSMADKPLPAEAAQSVGR